MRPAGDYKPTSERVSVDHFLGSAAGYLIYLTHVAAYDFASPRCRGRRVLDFGCGTGFGAHRLVPGCSEIVGVDVSESAVGYARQQYHAQNLTFLAVRPVPLAPLPFPGGVFDVVLSFQVIEHVADVDAYLAEVVRVLAPDGVFICATPDRRTRLLRGQRPWNIHHLTEYDPPALAAVLRPRFPDVELLGVTAGAEVAGMELRRRARAKWLTLPATFPGVPEWWRGFGLRLLERAAGQRHDLVAAGSPKTPEEASAAYGFDGRSVTIAREAGPALDILAVARTGAA